MMHQRITLTNAFRDAEQGMAAMRRASDRHALVMANRAAAVIHERAHVELSPGAFRAEGDAQDPERQSEAQDERTQKTGRDAAWYLIRVVGGLGVCAKRDASGAPVLDEYGRTVTVNDNRESVVVDSLVRAGIDAWCPRDVQVKRSPRRKSCEKFAVPMFPGYAFVRIPSTGAAMLGVLSFEGVLGFVCRGNEPVVVPVRLIEELKVYEALKPKERRLIASVFTVGEKLVIRSGPFAGYGGTVVGVDGRRGLVDIEATLFGGTVPMTIGLDAVARAV